MRHRIKKIPTLSKLSHNHHLLHSDKSDKDTYFYKSNGKVKNILYSPSIPLFGGAVLLLVLGWMVYPMIDNVGKVNAQNVTEEACNTEVRVGLELVDGSGDNVVLSKNVDNDIANGEISKVSQDFNVLACRVRNYQLYVQSDSSLLKNTAVPDALYGVGDKVAEDDFIENTWGYNLMTDNSTEPVTYSTIPDFSSAIPEAYSKLGGTANTGQDFTITFAAKFGKNKSAGHYTSNVMLSLVAEPMATTMGLYDVDYMQEMTTDVCYNSNENDTKRLIDNRDNKAYWVAKLKDGNCWMTQNLDLDLWSSETNGSVILTSNNSDVSADWKSTTGMSSVWSDVTNNNVKYYDPGMYVYTSPTVSNGCGNVSGLNNCASRGWTFVGDSMQASEDSDYGFTIVDDVYNAHYLIGNYYSWGAATAGQAASLNQVEPGQESTQSICPKGWRLPDGNDDSTEKSFYGLLTSYGASSGLSYGGQDIRIMPLFFLYGGYVYSGSLRNAGGQGNYLSSTAQSDTYMYTMYLYSDGVRTSNNDGRIGGFSIRCVAR